jgi:hypothetical protein
MVNIPLSPTYRVADALELELAFGDDSELAFGDALSLAEEEHEDKHGGTLDGAGENDKTENLICEAFRHLTYRTRTFGTAYPFTVQISYGLERLVSVENLDSDKNLYRFLLACSHMNKYTKAEQQNFADIFEEVCVPAAAAYLNGEAVRFGAAGKKGKSIFNAKLKVALPQLAKYLNVPPITFRIEQLQEENTGDAGIDVVARIPFLNDDLFGMVTALGQCTCSAKWDEKVKEAHPVNVEKYFSWHHPTLNFFFVPFFWRNIVGEWDNQNALHNSIPFDRLRICRLLTGKISNELAKDMEACLAAKPNLIGHAA